MTTVLENLIQLNERNKQHPESRKITLTREGNVYYLLEGNKYIEVSHIGILFIMLYANDFKPYYISNLSLIKNQGSIINNYLLNQKEWLALEDIFSRERSNSIRIIKVKNMKDYVTKCILVGGFKIELKHNCYVVLSNKNKDYILVSDINLVVNNQTSFVLSHTNTKKITIQNIDIANKKLGIVTDLSFLFYCCEDIETIELQNFDTRNVESFEAIFCSCTKLKEVNLNSITTENAKNLNSMFYGCCSIKELNLNHFKLDNVLDLKNMFRDCVSLEKLNIEKWNLRIDTQVNHIIDNCKKLNPLKVKLKTEIMYTTEDGQHVILSRDCVLKELITS